MSSDTTAHLLALPVPQIQVHATCAVVASAPCLSEVEVARCVTYVKVESIHSFSWFELRSRRTKTRGQAVHHRVDRDVDRDDDERLEQGDAEALRREAIQRDQDGHHDVELLVEGTHRCR